MPGQGDDKTEATVMVTSVDRAMRDARHTAQDHSQDRQTEIMEAVKAALVEYVSNIEVTITAKVWQEVTSVIPTTIIRASSGTTGVTAVTPFDWTRDKQMYQWWQTWSDQVRHAAVAMEGDGQKCKFCGKVGHFYKVCRSTKDNKVARVATGVLIVCR